MNNKKDTTATKMEVDDDDDLSIQEIEKKLAELSEKNLKLEAEIEELTRQLERGEAERRQQLREIERHLMTMIEGPLRRRDGVDKRG